MATNRINKKIRKTKQVHKRGVFYLNFLIYPLPEDEKVLAAHCLQMDLVAVGKTEEEAIAELKKVVESHILYAFENNLERSLYTPAPAHYWEKMQTESKAIRSATPDMFLERSPDPEPDDVKIEYASLVPAQ